MTSCFALGVSTTARIFLINRKLRALKFVYNSKRRQTYSHQAISEALKSVVWE